MSSSTIQKTNVVDDPWGIPLIGIRLSESFEEILAKNPGLRIEQNAKGEIFFMSPTGGETGYKNSRIISQLDQWSQSFGGRAFDSSTVFRLPNGAKRSPDASWISEERWNELSKQERKKFPPLCPDFLVELRSETDRLEDLQLKMQEYISVGLRLGWLIDPLLKQLHVYQVQKTVELFSEPITVRGEDVLPGFVLDLTTIWADS